MNSNYNIDVETRISDMGCFYCCGNVISCRLKSGSVVMLSTTESYYVFLLVIVKEILPFCTDDN